MMLSLLDTVESAIAAGEFEVAEADAEVGLAESPDDLVLRGKLALCLTKQLRFAEAMSHWRLILDAPQAGLSDRVPATFGLAICAAQSGEPHWARPYIDRLDMRFSPHPSDWCWRPRILAAAGFGDEAEAELRSLLSDRPGDPFIEQALGMVMLQRGDPEGHSLALAFSSRAFYQIYYSGTPLIERMWQGEPLEGRSITIVPHGGFGDLFQFIRHVPRLRNLGAGSITVAATSRCHGLLRSAGVDDLVGLEELEAARSRSECWIGTFGLARAGGESASGYLRAPPSAQADAILRQARSRAAGRPCIGLYWHSDMDLGEAKSIPLPALAPLFARTDIHWVILQRGFGLRRLQAAEIARDATVTRVELPFDDAGALIAGLDGVASICAWPFHLAGALGVRTWLLAGRVLDGRHLNRERDSVVYPACATLVRQPTVGDWPGAIALLMGELDALTRPQGPAALPAPEPC
ncbi:tetratricopeptide repeat protein [Methylobacterium sp. NFXW15]|uniref:tetratricopeptide repeat protein n=1 Tax=Methylobacterium sp. NFXW15 TaxID=2819512 RepID=UPI003CEC7CA0